MIFPGRYTPELPANHPVIGQLLTETRFTLFIQLKILTQLIQILITSPSQLTHGAQFMRDGNSDYPAFNMKKLTTSDTRWLIVGEILQFLVAL